MDNVICGISAFRFYRTPPAVLGLFESLPIARDQATRQSLSKQPLAQYVLGSPLHFLVQDTSSFTCAKTIKHHLWSGKLPRGAISEINNAGMITSPEMTLLLMARIMPPVRLALCMYEFCGTFTVYKIPSELKKHVIQNGTERLNRHAAWQEVLDSKGAPTGLWSRPPLLTPENLKEFAELNRSAYGSVNFEHAASMVVGVTRSPLEAEAALLLSLSRRLGGHGLTLKTNEIIRLNPRAKKIYQHEYCIADIYLESPDGRHIVDIECQGAAVHSGDAAVIADANRTTALETMGISVVLITYADIRSPERLDLIAQHILTKLGMKRHERTLRMRTAERKLRKEFPVDWNELSK